MELRGDDEIWLDATEADRYGELADETALGRLIAEHQSGPPVWSSVCPPAAEQLRADWADFLAGPETTQHRLVGR